MPSKDRLKEIRRDNDLSVTGMRLELNHWDIAKRDGGTDVFPTTLPEHARFHELLAQRGEDVKVNTWAAEEIKRRMTHAEREEYNRLYGKNVR